MSKFTDAAHINQYKQLLRESPQTPEKNHSTELFN